MKSRMKIPLKKGLVPGSKVPIAYLIDYIKEGYSLTEFLSDFPWIKRSAAERALEEIKKREFTSQHAF